MQIVDVGEGEVTCVALSSAALTGLLTVMVSIGLCLLVGSVCTALVGDHHISAGCHSTARAATAQLQRHSSMLLPTAACKSRN